LVLAENGNNFHYAYDFLALGYYHYTSVLLNDLKTIGNADVLIAPNERIGSQLIDYKNKYNLKFDKLIILNLDGLYGPLFSSDEEMTSSAFRGLNLAADWKAEGIGEGKISIPKVEDDYNSMLSLNKLISLNVEDGEYKYWSISNTPKKSLDLADSDLVKFMWHGNDDDRWYVIQFNSDSKNFFWYKFQDSWSGLRQVVLPTEMSIGKENVLGVNVQKTIKGNPSWGDLSEIIIRTAANNINNEGKFFFDGFVFDKNIYSSHIKYEKDEKLDFPLKLSINQKVVPGNFTVFANYEHSIPFALEKKYNDLDVHYINAYPLIQKINEGSYDSRKIYPLLANILEITDEKLKKYEPGVKIKYRYEPGGFFTFDNLNTVGNLTFSSSSIISKVDSKINITVDGKNFTKEDVRLILPISSKESYIKSNSATLENGTGFYSRIMMNSSRIIFQGEPAIISLITNDGNVEKIEGKHIQIESQNTESLLRQPSIHVEGISKFDSVIPHGGRLDKKLSPSEQDLVIEGTINFTNKYSDEYFFANNVTIKGKIIPTVPIYSYDELSSFWDIFT